MRLIKTDRNIMVDILDLLAHVLCFPTWPTQNVVKEIDNKKSTNNELLQIGIAKHPSKVVSQDTS